MKSILFWLQTSPARFSQKYEAAPSKFSTHLPTPSLSRILNGKHPDFSSESGRWTFSWDRQQKFKPQSWHRISELRLQKTQTDPVSEGIAISRNRNAEKFTVLKNRSSKVFFGWSGVADFCSWVNLHFKKLRSRTNPNGGTTATDLPFTLGLRFKLLLVASNVG